MAEEHERLVSKFAMRVVKQNFRILSRAPFVDYRPDIYARKGQDVLFAEIEIERTLHSEHTTGQLLRMYEYLCKGKRRTGYLVVPRSILGQAKLLLASLLGDRRIRAHGV